ncbi:RhuM family protein [Nitrosomonas marina]|uniref:Uncharacterized conserved protein n=1 Tax=Nitrosomonas marina TaxID=917 RepID=A0A1H8ISJ0_9PROT|nr:RhuM family protein [Nitrosomonas marina]SEN71633.1 Uncharacterized conserved protein [Nitrosomonas marina]
MDNQENINSIIYSEDGVDDIKVIIDDDTIWATQKNISDIFSVAKNTVGEHLSNIYKEGELNRDSTTRKFRVVQIEGDREVLRNIEHHNLDAIISVGYRVNSQKATKFRIWATGIIKQYIRDGYVINEAVLRDDPKRLNELAAKIRELRASEKNVFAQVKDCFKLSASDYEPTSDEVRSFYSLLQDKFHHAITKMTASKLIKDRADATEDNMGLISFKELLPTKQEAKTGKNYLTEDELYRMYLLSEQFLLFAESSALMGKQLTMKQLHDQLDNLLKLNGYPVFEGYMDYIRDEAMKHAESEYETFIELKKLEMLGVDVDYTDYVIGEYNLYREQMDQITLAKLRDHFRKKYQDIIEHKPKNIGRLTNALRVALDHNPNK